MNGWSGNMQYRYDIINSLIKENKYEKYLEIGVRRSKDCFDRINCKIKHAVDPSFLQAPKEYPKTSQNFHMTSDEFFAQNKNKYDIIFVDGLHTAEQVYKDVENGLKVLKKGGTIVMHDCNPPTEWHQRPAEQYNGSGSWNGTVWKAFVKLRNNPDLKMLTIDTDCGVGIVQQGKQEPLFVPEGQLTYLGLDMNRVEWLNLMTVKNFEKTSKKT